MKAYYFYMSKTRVVSITGVNVTYLFEKKKTSNYTARSFEDRLSLIIVDASFKRTR